MCTLSLGSQQSVLENGLKAYVRAVISENERIKIDKLDETDFPRKNRLIEDN